LSATETLPSSRSVPYSVTVSNPYQSVSSSAVQATSLSPPVITSQPPATLWLPGGITQRLTINASPIGPSFAEIILPSAGFPAETYQWRRNGVLLPSTSSEIFITSTNAADSGDYTFTVSNASGSVTSRACRINVGAPLTIQTQPADVTAVRGGSATFTVKAVGDFEPYTYQWYYGYPPFGVSPPITGATSPTLVLNNLQSEHDFNYTVKVTGTSGLSIYSRAARLTMTGSAPMLQPPVLLSQPSDTTLLVGQSLRLDYQFLGATNIQLYQGSLSRTSQIGFPVQLSDAGLYTVVGTNAAGSVTSRQVVVTVRSTAAISDVTMLSRSRDAISGDSVQLTAVAHGGGNPFTYRWRLNGVELPGETGETLSLPSVTAAQAGDYQSVAYATNGESLASAVSTLTVLPPRARMINLSVRTSAGTGAQALIAGFSVRGAGTKPLLVRGIGPTLASFGVSGVLNDPLLTLANQAGVTLASVSGWSQDPQLATTFASVGAFALPVNSADAALATSLTPAPYTVTIASKSGGRGVALAEVYDLTPASTTADLGNISARALAGPDSQALVAGFVVVGDGPVNALIRGVGPGLATFGVANPLAKVRLEVHTTVNGADRIVASNYGWGGSAGLKQTATRVGAFSLPAADDTAIVTALSPGAYTVVVAGAEGFSGVALVEVYLIQ
jgi:hypothetical protein